MSAKEIILETVREMADTMSMDEILEELEIVAGIRQGEQGADEGKIISHEALKIRLTTDDCLADLVGAAGSSLDFWDNPQDDEDWNNA